MECASARSPTNDCLGVLLRMVVWVLMLLLMLLLLLLLLQLRLLRGSCLHLLQQGAFHRSHCEPWSHHAHAHARRRLYTHAPKGKGCLERMHRREDRGFRRKGACRVSRHRKPQVGIAVERVGRTHLRCRCCSDICKHNRHMVRVAVSGWVWPAAVAGGCTCRRRLSTAAGRPFHPFFAPRRVRSLTPPHSSVAHSRHTLQRPPVAPGRGKRCGARTPGVHRARAGNRCRR